MIKYSLRCGGCDFGFEGWFRNSEAFEAQAAQGHLNCPACAAASVARAPMAPAVVGSPKRHAAAIDPPAADTAPPGPAVDPRGPMLAMLRQIRRAVEANADNVGAAFADQALKMHDGEISQRPIYGDATPEESEKLESAGVAVRRIPWAPLDDA